MTCQVETLARCRARWHRLLDRLAHKNEKFAIQRNYGWCELANSTVYILKHKNGVLKKIKLPKLYICSKLAIRILPELLEVVQSENMWSFFCDPIDNFEQVSQITLTCLLPNLPAFFVRETFHSIQHCFYKANIFHISWSFISNFFIVLWLQKMCEILKATARYWENNFFFGKLLFLTLTNSKRLLRYWFKIFGQAN